MIVRSLPIGLFALAFAVVLLADGGVYPLSLSVATIAMAMSLLIAVAQHRLHPPTATVFMVCLLAWLILSAWILLQVSPLPAGMLSNPAWRRLAEHGLGGGTALISIAPGNAVYSLLPFGLAFMTLLAALLLFRTDRQVEDVLTVIGIVGAAMALLAIVQFTLFPATLMFGPKLDYLSSLTAPFVNRNTAATFYGLVLIVLLVNLSLQASAGRPHGRLPGARWRSRWLTGGMAGVTLLALALTTSRGGILAAMVAGGGLVVALAALHWRGGAAPTSRIGSRATARRPSRRAVSRAFAVVLLCAVAGLLLFGRTLFRASRMGGEDGRFCVYPAVVTAIEDNSITGIGAGGLETYLPAYRDPSCGLMDAWQRAHNGYLDLALALGVPAAFILLAGATLLLAHATRRGIRHRISRKPIVLGGVSFFLLLFIHSAIDFSLQIPAVAMLFMLVMATSLTVSLNYGGRARSKTSPRTV